MFSLQVQPVRLMTKAQAATYCARSPKLFEGQCPVPPVVMSNGDRLWDIQDLDRWIDSLKAGTLTPTQDEFLARFG